MNQPETLVDASGGGFCHLPEHIAVIMDGNGRWARQKHLPRVEGHRAGARTVRMIVEESRSLGIKYLTLFAFSSENWNRPLEEISALMKLLEGFLRSELAKLLENGIRLRAIGDLSKLPSSSRQMLLEDIAKTENMDGMQLILAISYGGREEIVTAAKSLAARVRDNDLKPEDISQDVFARALYAPDVPDPDLLIRTSGELRVSNFLLWQLAYSEIVVSPLLWPDFTKEEFHRCIAAYGRRERRFGLTGDQIAQAAR